MDRTSIAAAPRARRSNTCASAVRVLREDDAATAIEYALLAALIAVVCVVAMQATGASLTALYVYWSAAVSAAL